MAHPWRQQIFILLHCEIQLCLTSSFFSFLQENGLTFSFEAVRRLQELAESSAVMGPASPRLRAGTVSLCADPLLPQEFLPLCRQRGASASMARLGEDSRPTCGTGGAAGVCRPDGFFLCFSYGSYGSLRDLRLCSLRRLLNHQAETYPQLQISDLGLYTQFLIVP